MSEHEPDGKIKPPATEPTPFETRPGIAAATTAGLAAASTPVVSEAEVEEVRPAALRETPAPEVLAEKPQPVTKAEGAAKAEAEGAEEREPTLKAGAEEAERPLEPVAAKPRTKEQAEAEAKEEEVKTKEGAAKETTDTARETLSEFEGEAGVAAGALSPAEAAEKKKAKGEKAAVEEVQKKAKGEKATEEQRKAEGAMAEAGKEAAAAAGGEGAAAGPAAAGTSGAAPAAPEVAGGEPQGGTEEEGAAELEERLAKADPERAAADEADPAEVAMGELVEAEGETPSETLAEPAPIASFAETMPPEPTPGETPPIAPEYTGPESLGSEAMGGEMPSPTMAAAEGAKGLGATPAKTVGETPAEAGPETEEEPSAEGFSGDEPALGGGALEHSAEAPDLSETEKTVALESIGESAGGGGASGGGGGGGGAVPEKPRPDVPDVSSEEPSAALGKIGNLPPVQLKQAFGGLNAAVSKDAGDKRSELAANPPKMERPTGSPKNLHGQAPVEAPAAGKKAGKVDQAAEGKDQPTPEAKPLPELPPSPAEKVKEPTVTGTESGELTERDVRRMSSSISSLPTVAPGLKATADPAPQVELTGNANPAQADEQRQKLQASVTDTQAQGRRDVAQEMGENTRIFPSVAPETLTAKVPKGGVAGGGGGKPTAAGGSPADQEALSIIAHEEKGGEIQVAVAKVQSDMAAKKEDYATKVGEEKAKSAKEIAALEAKSTAEQAQVRSKAQAKVRGKKTEWSEEQEKKVREANQEADSEVAKGRKEVQKQKQDADHQAVEHIKKGNEEAERERRKAEQTAAEEKRKGKKESKGFFGWLASKAKAFFNKIKAAIKAAFDLARKLIKKAIEVAKKAAMWAIEQARKMIVAAIKAVGKALIAIGDRLLADFPALRDKFRKFIQDKVDKAVKKVNEYAEQLKKDVAAALDALAAGLDKLIGWLEKGMLAVVDAAAAVVDGAIKFAEKVAQAIGAFVSLIKDVASGPIQWLKNLGAGIVDGIKNHLWKAFKEAVQQWFNSKLEQVLGLGKMVWDLIKSGGLALAQVGKMAWEGLKAMIPPTLTRILVEKLVAMLVPAAGAIMLIIEGLQAAWGAIKRILAAFQKFFAFLKAVVTGNAGPPFAQALVAAAIAVIDFVANWLIAKLAKGAAKVGGKIKALAKKILGRKKGRAMARKVKAKAKPGKTPKPKKPAKPPKAKKPKKGKDKKADKKKDKEKKKRERLERARRELPQKIRRLLKNGVSKIRLKATLALWRMKYRLRVLQLKGHKIVAANSADIDIYETFEITPAELLREVRKILDDLLGSEKARNEQKKLEANVTNIDVENERKVIDASGTSILGKIRYIRERNAREAKRGKQDGEETTFVTDGRGSTIGRGSGIKAWGVTKGGGELKRAYVGDYLEETAKRVDVTIVERILKLQHKFGFYGKRGLKKLSMLMRQAARGLPLSAKGPLQEQARVRGALEGVLVAEGVRDPAALMDFALTADLLERGSSQREVTEALRDLPMSHKGTGRKTAVELRERFYKSDMSLRDLEKEVRKDTIGGKTAQDERKAGLYSLQKRVDLLERVLKQAAEANEFNDRAGLIEYLEKRAKAFIEDKG
jgi:hypothetical protein